MPLPVVIGAGVSAAGSEAYRQAREWVGDIVSGKRTKSSCRHVSPGDVGCFMGGTCAPWVPYDRLWDIEAAHGIPAGTMQHETALAKFGLSFQDLAQLHMTSFVPLCDRIEGGEQNYTRDPNSGKGLEIYNAARAEFVDMIRSGRIHWKQAPRGGGGGDMPSVPGSTPGGMEAPTQAGGAVLAIGALIAFAIFASR